MPGTRVSPRGSSAAAAAHPSLVSWSVRATTSRPAAAAAATSPAGVSVPSDTEEWVCRSIRITGQPAARSARRERRDRLGVLRPGRPRRLAAGRRTGGCVLALVVLRGRGGGEQQRADRAVELVGARQEGDLRERLVLAGGLDAEG